MSVRTKYLAFALALAAVCLAAAPAAQACSTCFGEPEHPQTKGMNAAIVTLLGVTYGLFTAIALTAFVLWRRRLRAPVEEETAAPLPGDDSHG